MSHSVVVLFLLALVGINTINGQDPCEGGTGRCIGGKLALNPYTRCDKLIPNYIGLFEECPLVNKKKPLGPRETCCLDCNNINEICEGNSTGSVGRSSCCSTELVVVTEPVLGSSCECCQVCKPRGPNYKCCNRKKKNKTVYSRCITEADPHYNPDWCVSQRGQVKPWCEGDGCLCCYHYKP